jgi:ADP-ribosylglycohydrolase
VESAIHPGTGQDLPGRHPFAFGQVTDDTQLARELLLSLSEDGRFAGERFAHRLLALVESGGVVGGGPATHQTARKLAAGVAWQDAGMAPPYAGNGAAMRAGPLGMAFGQDPDLLTGVVLAQSRVTHHDPRAGGAALAVAGAVAIAARRDRIVPESYLEEVAILVDPVEGEVATVVRRIASWHSLAPEQAFLALLECAKPDKGYGRSAGVSSHAPISVAWSLYAFLTAPEDFGRAVSTAIMAGGDTDTVAAMTGAMVGARVGLGGLPGHWVARVNDRGRWRAPDLEVLARRSRLLAGTAIR